MSQSRKATVPVLTEVLGAGDTSQPARGDEPIAQASHPPVVGNNDPAMPTPSDATPWVGASTSQPQDHEHAALTARVLTDVQRQIDLMVEHRVARALEPVFASLTESVASQSRQAIHEALRDVVASAVARELASVREESMHSDGRSKDRSKDRSNGDPSASV